MGPCFRRDDIVERLVEMSAHPTAGGAGQLHWIVCTTSEVGRLVTVGSFSSLTISSS
jgi:hypothetical protein